MVNSTPDGISLTAATSADLDFLFELKCEPESIRWGGFATAPKFNSLKIHYEKVFAAKDRIVLIIRKSQEPAGVISYRLCEDGDCRDYSINVSRQFAGQGVGVAALKQSAKILSAGSNPCRRIIALIREDNQRSQRIFSAAGYKRSPVCEDRRIDIGAQSVQLVEWVKLLG